MPGTELFGTLPFSLGGPPTILDGGLATELEAQGHDLTDALWSARLLADSPEAVTAAHLAFYRAGASVATTASYQASFAGFAARGVSRPAAAALMARSVELARDAADQLADDGVRRWVAASVGPYGAALADGSQYQGRYGLLGRRADRVGTAPGWRSSPAPSRTSWPSRRFPSVARRRAALMERVSGLGVPAWLTYSIEGAADPGGSAAATGRSRVAAGVDGVVAVGVDCCRPEDVAAAVETAMAVSGKPVVVYPNSGEGWDAQRRTWSGRSGFSAADAKSWRAAGAAVIGGCCRISPADIADLVQTFCQTIRAPQRTKRLTARRRRSRAATPRAGRATRPRPRAGRARRRRRARPGARGGTPAAG